MAGRVRPAKSVVTVPLLHIVLIRHTQTSSGVDRLFSCPYIIHRSTDLGRPARLDQHISTSRSTARSLLFSRIVTVALSCSPTVVQPYSELELHTQRRISDPSVTTTRTNNVQNRHRHSCARAGSVRLSRAYRAAGNQCSCTSLSAPPLPCRGMLQAPDRSPHTTEKEV